MINTLLPAAISSLLREGKISKSKAEKAMENLNIDPDAPEPSRN